MWTIAFSMFLGAPTTIAEIFPEDYFANLALNQLIKMGKINTKKKKKRRKTKQLKVESKRGTERSNMIELTFFTLMF